MKIKKLKATKTLTLQSLVMQRLKCNVFLKVAQFWLDTGSPSANSVLGSKKFGAPSGRMFEVAGEKHVGKSAKVMFLAGLSQRQHNAFVLWVDAEGSLQNESKYKDRFYNKWAKKLGLDLSPENFYCIYPKILKQKVGRRKGKKITKAGSSFIQSAEFLLKEAEEAIHIIKENEPDRPIFLAIDSVANLQTEMSMDAGFTDRNMRVNMDRAQFLSYALPRLVTLAVNYSAWVFLINQLRTSLKMFGDPRYTPGGKAKDHNCHVQVWMSRSEKNSEEDESGDLVKISGKMINVKNKAGGGSLQSQKCSYTINFDKKFNRMFRFGPLIK